MKSLKRFLSLGAGVQSSTLALMIAKGEIPPVDAAIFADTGWEPRRVYDWLDFLSMAIQAAECPFPIYRVSSGNLREDTINGSNSTGQRFASIPWFMRNKDGSQSMGMRQCTNEYKIRPLQEKMRELLGLKKGEKSSGALCEILLGISWDERSRMNPSKNAWSEHRFPLVEKQMTRVDCIRWMQKNEYPTPPKSSCIGCPYHSDDEWRNIKSDPIAWADAVAIDKIIRNPNNGSKSEQYMHRSCVPLDQVDLETLEEKGQLNMFLDDCEGMCGV